MTKGKPGDFDRAVAANHRRGAAECRRVMGLTTDQEILTALRNLSRVREQRAARYEGYATEADYSHLYQDQESL